MIKTKYILPVILLSIIITGCSPTQKDNSNNSQSQSTKVKKNHPKPTHKKYVSHASKANNNNSTNQNNSFYKQPWTSDSALEFLRKVDASSAQGKEYINEENCSYGISNPDKISPKLPGNSIFVFENNRSGFGDGAVVLTKNSDNTVTIIIGTGAVAEPAQKVIVNSQNYQIISVTNLSGYENMLQYFGIADPEDNNSNSDTNDNAEESNQNDNSDQTNTSTEDNNYNQAPDSDSDNSDAE